MAVSLLPVPTLNISSVTGAPVALPVSEATSLTGATGFNFVNNGAILLRVCIGSSGTGTMSVLLQRAIEGFLTGTPLFTTGTLANSTNYIFGPFSPSDLNDVNGTVQCTMSVYTGNSAGLYFLPAART